MGPFTKTGNISGENVWGKMTGALTLDTERDKQMKISSRELEIQVKSKI